MAYLARKIVHTLHGAKIAPSSCRFFLTKNSIVHAQWSSQRRRFDRHYIPSRETGCQLRYRIFQLLVLSMHHTLFTCTVQPHALHVQQLPHSYMSWFQVKKHYKIVLNYCITVQQHAITKFIARSWNLHANFLLSWYTVRTKYHTLLHNNFCYASSSLLEVKLVVTNAFH